MRINIKDRRKDFMVFKIIFIVDTILAYSISRIRKDNDSEGWVKIKNETFHKIFFWNGYWEYRPCDIVMAVIGEIGFVIGICMLPFELSDQFKKGFIIVGAIILIISLFISFIYEGTVIHKKRKKADQLGRFIKNLNRKR